jgi:hypothetical protein
VIVAAAGAVEEGERGGRLGRARHRERLFSVHLVIVVVVKLILDQTVELQRHATRPVLRRGRALGLDLGPAEVSFKASEKSAQAKKGLPAPNRAAGPECIECAASRLCSLGRPAPPFQKAPLARSVVARHATAKRTSSEQSATAGIARQEGGTRLLTVKGATLTHRASGDGATRIIVWTHTG